MSPFSITRRQFGSYTVFFCTGPADAEWDGPLPKDSPEHIVVNDHPFFPAEQRFLVVRHNGDKLKKDLITLQPGETMMVEIGQIFFLSEGQVKTPLGSVKEPPAIIACVVGFNDQHSEPRHVEICALTAVRGTRVRK